ncbi:MAG: DUF2800 domain-containing protein, partial [Bacteroidales bacterium]|nr:DUF2800 domain-containing protein [Bacteroidales bacterium]
MGKHALLSASSAKRWLSCPPSARLCESYADKSSGYAQEGTDAHVLGEFQLRKALGEDVSAVADLRKHLAYYSEEMEECANGYATYILELLSAAKQTCADPVVLIEQRLDFSRYVSDGFGTGDCVIIADGTLHICDYKHGQGVLVDAEDNPQMKLYALGALELFDGIYDISTVSMTIYQPRRNNISTHTVIKETLYQWAEEVLKPAAQLAFTGEGEFKCGDHCQFCKAKAECRERVKANMALAAYDFAEPPLLENDEIASLLGKIDQLVSWASDIKEFALTEALKGIAFDGWKVVEGRSNRKYTDETAVAKAVESIGLDPYEHKVLGITAMTGLLGKKRFEETLG